MNRKGGVPVGADRDPSKSEICAGNQRDGRKSKGSLFGAKSQPWLSGRLARSTSPTFMAIVGRCAWISDLTSGVSFRVWFLEAAVDLLLPPVKRVPSS